MLEYKPEYIDKICDTEIKKSKNAVMSSKRKAIVAALTDEEKLVARAYLEGIGSGAREAVEFAKEAIESGEVDIMEGVTFIDYVKDLVENNAISQNVLLNHIDYDALADTIRDELNDTTQYVYEGDDGVVIIY